MKHTRLAAIFFAGPLSLMSTAAHAETAVTPSLVGLTEQDVGVMDRERPAYDAKGIPLGGFRLFPVLDLEAGYDDNVFRLETPQSDFCFTIAPGLRLQSQWGRHFVELYSGLKHYEYTRFAGQNLTDWNVGTDGRLDISHAAAIQANVSFAELHELWSSPNNIAGYQAAPNRYYQTHADVQGVYQPNRLGAAIGFSFDRFGWLDTPKIGGGLLTNSDRDEDIYQAFAKVFYEFSPGYSAFVRASYDQRVFDQRLDRSGIDRASHGYRLDGGVRLQLSHMVRGELFVGYLDQNFRKNTSSPLKNVSGLDYGAQLDWFATPVLTVHISGSRQLQDIVLSGVSVADNRNVTISADYEFRPNIIFQVKGGYSDVRYVGSPRSDTYPSVGITMRYLINRYVSANIGYAFERRSSDSAGVDYADNTASIGLTIHL